MESQELSTDDTDELIDSLHRRMFGEPYYPDGVPKGDRFVAYVVGVAAEPIQVGQVLEARMNRRTGMVTIHPITTPVADDEGIGSAHITKPRDGSNPLG